VPLDYKGCFICIFFVGVRRPLPPEGLLGFCPLTPVNGVFLLPPLLFPPPLTFVLVVFKSDSVPPDADVGTLLLLPLFIGGRNS